MTGVNGKFSLNFNRLNRFSGYCSIRCRKRIRQSCRSHNMPMGIKIWNVFHNYNPLNFYFLDPFWTVFGIGRMWSLTNHAGAMLKCCWWWLSFWYWEHQRGNKDINWEAWIYSGVLSLPKVRINVFVLTVFVFVNGLTSVTPLVFSERWGDTVTGWESLAEMVSTKNGPDHNNSLVFFDLRL